MAAAARAYSDPNQEDLERSSSARRGVPRPTRTSPQARNIPPRTNPSNQARDQANKLSDLLKAQQTKPTQTTRRFQTPQSPPMAQKAPTYKPSPFRPPQIGAGDADRPARAAQSSSDEFGNTNPNASVLDAANQGFSPYQQAANDNDEQDESTAARNRRFQQQQRNASQVAGQFLSGAFLGGLATQGANLLPGESSTGISRLARNEAKNAAYDYDIQQSKRFREYLKQRATAQRANNKLNEKAEEESERAQTSVEILETIQRGRRLFTAITGVGVVLAVAETDLVAINRGFFKGSVRILPGSRPKNQQYRHKSDYVDIGMALLMHVVGIVMLFGLFIEMLPILIPFIAAIVGPIVLQQMFGDSVASLLSSLIH